jgi:hypothetical protein
MTLIDILNLGGTHAGDALKAQLEAELAQFPDAAPAINRVLAALTTDFEPQQIVELGVAILPEALNVLKGHLDPHKHAGDAT